MYDLRSDTVKPTPAMRRAMAAAATGDDLFGEDPTTRKLEEFAAELLGKASALFLPTGTLANAVALMTHRQAGCSPRVLLDVQSHIRRREMTWPSVLAELVPVDHDRSDGCPDVEDIEQWHASVAGRGLICLETTHTWRSGRAADLGRWHAVAAAARRLGAAVYLDGARLFNAAVCRGVAPRVIAGAADSVMVCLSKSIGAPAGAVLAGPEDFIAAAGKVRLAMGGTMRQTGNLAAAGLVALRSDLGRLAEDHARARRLAESLGRFQNLDIRPEEFETNVVIFSTAGLGVSGELFAALAADAGVRVALLAADRVRLATHRDLGDADIDGAAAALGRVVEKLAGCAMGSRGAVQ